MASLRGMLHHLDRSKFEVILYHTDATTDSETESARSLVDRLELSPRDWVRLIRGDAPDILFYPDLAMEPATFELGLLRLAPLQVTTWGPRGAGNYLPYCIFI
jgi:predicted O-linked N-acetylglucosamine transferase (SPINDLY family)